MRMRWPSTCICDPKATTMLCSSPFRSAAASIGRRACPGRLAVYGHPLRCRMDRTGAPTCTQSCTTTGQSGQACCCCCNPLSAALPLRHSSAFSPLHSPPCGFGSAPYSAPLCKHCFSAPRSPPCSVPPCRHRFSARAVRLGYNVMQVLGGGRDWREKGTRGGEGRREAGNIVPLDVVSHPCPSACADGHGHHVLRGPLRPPEGSAAERLPGAWVRESSSSVLGRCYRYILN